MEPQEIAKQLQLQLKNFKEVFDPEALKRSGDRNADDGSPVAYYVRDDQQKIIGLNLWGQKLGDEQIRLLWKLPWLQVLNLSENELTAIRIPAELKALTYLGLGENPALQEVIFSDGLPALEEINIEECGLTEFTLPGGFLKLKKLDLKQNKLSRVHFSGGSPELAFLDLSNNQLVSLSLPGDLAELKLIYLSENKLTSLKFNGDLAALQTLHLNNNELEELTFSSGFNVLQHLNLQGNKISDIRFFAHLPALHTLDLSNNHLEEVAASSGFDQLQHLYLSQNKISDLQPLARLSTLRTLDLRENAVADLNPLRLLIERGLDVNWQWGSGILLKDNPLASPPVEIVEQGRDAVMKWFVANKKALQEIKVLLVGEAKAGKTSILRRLKKNEFNLDEVQTDGIIIESFDFEKLPTFAKQPDLHGIIAYFWDFGGQEIMNSTHQFFMTKRSVYLLILEARRDEKTDEQVRKWLKRIQTFGGDSPVIVVGNKIDLNRAFSLDKHSLKKEFPQIKGFVEGLSCKSGENIDKLRELLETYILQAELFDTQIDERWIQVKEDLQKTTKEKRYIGEKEFHRICVKYQLTDPVEQEQAITFLNDLGIVLHFNELDLSEYYVLDPYWVTSGVYRIVTSQTAARQKGRIKRSQLKYIVNEEPRKQGGYLSETAGLQKYGPNELRYLADIMAQFKLSYYMDNRQTILIPDLLDRETPADQSDRFYEATEKLSLVYQYDYLPSSVLPRFMVDLHKDIVYSWRTGVILGSNTNIQAEAMLTTTENKIRIIVTGLHKHKREYLSVIRFFLDSTSTDFNLKPKLLIPLPGYEPVTVPYIGLVRREQQGIPIYQDFDHDIDEVFEISKLLEGIESQEEIQRQGERIRQSYEDKNHKKKILFICSSPKGTNPLSFSQELKSIQDAHMQSLKRDRFEEPIIKTCVAAEDFAALVLQYKPAIVHLTMHGSKTQGLFFENKEGAREAVSPDKLAEYFKGIAKEYKPDLCILSACNTFGHAEAIKDYVHCAIGTRDFFPDQAAAIYAGKLYEIIFAETKMETAHYFGCQALKDIHEKDGKSLSFKNQQFPIHKIPVLIPNK